MSWSSSQALELLVILCTADNIRNIIHRIRVATALSESKSGPVRPDSMPTRLSVFIIPVQVFTHLVVPLVYMFTLVYCRLQKPAWMNALALPDVVFGTRVEGLWRNTTRVLACIASIASQRPLDDAFKHLGDQFHAIGRREKPRIVRTGPYAWVRHPIYSMVLLQETLFSLMFWSYVPLLAVIALVIVFAIKIPIEEEAIQKDETMKEEYHTYMKEVPWKLVPYVW